MVIDRSQKSEVRRQKTEDRKQKTGDRGQNTENRRQKTENRGQRTEDRENNIKISIQDLSVWYADTQAVKRVRLNIEANKVTAIIGPSGCGKSTLLRMINRMNDIIPTARMKGKILLDGANIYGEGMNVVKVRQRVGMVFQKSNPFPKSVFENVAYGPRINGLLRKKEGLRERVEQSLKDAALWDEVKDRLGDSALDLSGGQQQRLCIARALAVEPEVVLFDEPCSALDPTATAKIEELMQNLKKKYTIIIVTHNMQQAARISDFCAFLMLGELIEFDKTDKIFTAPSKKITEDYITGRFG